MTSWIRKAAFFVLLTIATSPLLAPAPVSASSTWPDDSIIYTIYPSIFSQQQNFAAITAQLPRIKRLGATVIWLMPITPVGQPIGNHPAFNSPYCVHDYYAINSLYGTGADLDTLVSRAHKLGLKVILDEVLNHTSWDNALVTQHPEFYLHSDDNPDNPDSIKVAFNFNDVAQLNYANPNLRAYMVRMLRFWILRHNVDGFRFDTADDPDGPGRMIPADFWADLGYQLRQTKPDILLLGECQTPDLALKPFPLDYAWRMSGALKAAWNGGDASGIKETWLYQTNNFPTGMKHMSIQDDWDMPRDVNALGGPDGAIAAAVFNFTNTGVPLIYNGMEIGNTAEAVNPHTPIDWNSGDHRFSRFYTSISHFRRNTPAMTSGTLTWVDNSLPSQLLTYVRIGGGKEYLVEINPSQSPASGYFKNLSGSDWKQVPLISLHGDGEVINSAPPTITLPAKGFAIFERSVSGG